jgi:hypothetical protein
VFRFGVSRFGLAPMVGTKMLSALDAMEQQALAELSTVLGGLALETFCVRWFGTNGRLRAAMDALKR